MAAIFSQEQGLLRPEIKGPAGKDAAIDRSSSIVLDVWVSTLDRGANYLR